ncbi:MAG: phosphatase [Defluviitaleaceae bacterium]|nr:phosphatase [Defluviitaleaceae bacterium]
MKIFLDVHLHTVASGHAYSTATENAAHAASIGLTHIGCADHGPAMPGAPHFYHFGNLRVLPDFIHGVRVLKGCEVNILDTDGTVDITNEYMAMLDFIIASMHRGVFIPTYAADHTRAIITAMENPYINVLGHPGDAHFDIDFEAVVDAAARTGTAIEINNLSLSPLAFRYNGDEPQQRLIRLCVANNVPMLLSSDAHYHTRVGDVADALRLVTEANVPESLILNTNPARFLEFVAAKRARIAPLSGA